VRGIGPLPKFGKRFASAGRKRKKKYRQQDQRPAGPTKLVLSLVYAKSQEDATFTNSDSASRS